MMKLLYSAIVVSTIILTTLLFLCLKSNKTKPLIGLSDRDNNSDNGTIKENCIIKGFSKGKEIL